MMAWGLRKPTVMKRFPIACVDGFFDDPDAIREYALSLEYFPNNGDYPGQRSTTLHRINEPMFESFCSKIFALFYDYDLSPATWKVTTGFHKMDPLDPDPNSWLNKGWIHNDTHQDEVRMLAGIVYLNPDIDPELGTSIYEPNMEKYLREFGPIAPMAVDSKVRLWKDGINEPDKNGMLYEDYVKIQYSCFHESARFYNRYNRLIMYPPDMWHAFNSSYSPKESRLTQVFFASNVVSQSDYPIQRLRKKY